ncbi:hypothetical protein R7P07_22820 [Vibrio sp. Vb2133]|uniref:hypothetical protein n=1 Tax=unclassified Vibrio TaxID=2614977 RepID=UPI002963CEBA|nr:MULTISPECIES: hypothetical protein [unclassified Vibrio]MDW1751177.1 hypothetical protein [Vibrio sp. Vb2133]MDW1793606.1 hypothetical protein [Vibrio sp. Vb2132]MDW3149439.1 hypothetical protein [Vibrio sp. 2132-1]
MRKNELKNNVQNIIEILISRESAFSGLKKYIKEHKLEASLFSLILIMILATIISGYLYPSVAYIFFMLIYIFIILYGLLSTATSAKFFVSATKWTMKSVKTRFSDNYTLAENLSRYDDKSLEHVITLFNDRIVFLQGRVGFLVGALDKLGVIPAVIMLYFSYAKVFTDKDVFEMPPLVLGIVSGVYIGAISARMVTDSLCEKIATLELARKIRNSHMDSRFKNRLSSNETKNIDN